jgi:hypothetical protein
MERPELLSTEQIARRIKIVRSVYLVYVCFGVFAIMTIIFGSSEGSPPKEGGEWLLVIWASLFTYYGLRKRRDWVLPLLHILSAIMLVGSLIIVLSPAQDLPSLLGKTPCVGFALFSIYQIYLFQKQEVKDFLGTDGKVII